MTHLRRALALSACALGGVAACDRAPAPPPAAAVAYDFARDDRLVHLLGGCTRDEPFTGDTTDLLPTIVAKLATAESMVASRARGDLIALGPAAVPELRRAFQRWFAEPGMAPRLLVLLDLAALASGPEARSMGLEGLEHPSESIATAAARVLSAAGTPADYDRLAIGVARGGDEHAAECALALAHCDPARLLREVPEWPEQPAQARVVDALAPRLAPIADAETCARVLAAENLPPGAQAWFTARRAALGDSESLARVRAALADANPMLRHRTFQAALGTGLASVAVPLALGDEDPALRVLAVEATAAAADAPERRQQLTAALADADGGVRKAALTALCARGDPAAIDAAIELYAGTSDDVALASGALREPMSRDAALAERVLARLEELLHGGVRSTGHAIERAIGQVPLARAAEILVLRGRSDPGTIQDLPAHRWYTVQAGNAGAAGRAWIRARWGSETDAVRRLDLISAGSQERSAESARFLEEVLAATRATDPERLLAVDLYARSMPVAQSAPLLKRAVAEITTPALRRAANCLLWRYYGS